MQNLMFYKETWNNCKLRSCDCSWKKTSGIVEKGVIQLQSCIVVLVGT